jgi:pentatricopeptide repeat protein
VYIKSGDTDEAFRLCRTMQSDYESGKNKNCLPSMRTYTTILNALQLSNIPSSIEKAEQILHAIPSPHTFAYTILISMYAQKGDVEKAMRLLRKMQSDFTTGKNRDCKPDHQTHGAILKAWQYSNRPDTVEKAEQIFNSFSLPNSFAYLNMLKIYAARGMGKEAVSLVRRMQAQFESGKSRNCKPHAFTTDLLNKAIHLSQDATLKKECRDVFQWLRMQPKYL